MSQLWSDERIITAVQQCAQGVENREVICALQLAMQTMRNEYEQRITEVEAQQWQPVGEAVTINCTDNQSNLLAYLTVQGPAVSITTQRHTYSTLLAEPHRFCQRTDISK